jgi:outer membrane biosynthesis protein TonB
VSVPIDVEIRDDRPAPAQQQTAAMPQGDERRPPSNTTPLGAEPSAGEPVPDALETKLQALAKLRQPDSDTKIAAMTSNLPGSSGAGTPGQGLKDFIRAQVERRWNLDLASLGDSEFTVAIHVKMTKDGVVLKAEIVNSSRSNDPAYREIAVSARNAVTLSSPIALPPGNYQDVMDMVLELNPRDTLR